MAQLRQDYQAFIDRNTEIIAIGPEDMQTFTNWWHNEHMPFVGIADPEHIIAKMYGQKVNPLKFGRMPAMVVIDKDGNIRFSHHGDSMSDIPSNKDVISLLDDINRAENAVDNSTKTDNSPEKKQSTRQ
jgi:peroxiredoxin